MILSLCLFLPVILVDYLWYFWVCFWKRKSQWESWMPSNDKNDKMWKMRHNGCDKTYVLKPVCCNWRSTELAVTWLNISLAYELETEKPDSLAKSGKKRGCLPEPLKHWWTCLLVVYQQAEVSYCRRAILILFTKQNHYIHIGFGQCGHTSVFAECQRAKGRVHPGEAAGLLQGK